MGGDNLLLPVQHKHQIAHFLFCGEINVGKTRLARTFPFPQKWFFADARGKDEPLFEQARHQGNHIEQLELSIGNSVIPMTRVYGKSGRIIREIEYYGDDEPERPTAYGLFQARMCAFDAVERAKWGTAIFDSSSQFAVLSRMKAQFVDKPNAKEPRQWFAQATDDLERMFQVRTSRWNCNTIVIAHSARAGEYDSVGGEQIINSNLPGRLATGLPSQYGEYYRMFIRPGENGERLRVLQTMPDGRFGAGTQIHAPDQLVDPTYDKLWKE